MPAATVQTGLADALRARLAGERDRPGRDRPRTSAGGASRRGGPTRARRRSPAARRATTSSPRWPWPRTAGCRSRSAPAGTSDRAAGDGALVLDLSPMDGIELDPAARTARVGPGGHVGGARRGRPSGHGLAVTGGRGSRASGPGGVALGDGSGWLERCARPDRRGAWPAASSYLRTVGVLEVGGEAEAPELLWALRGAGARLGVVTRARPAACTRSARCCCAASSASRVTARGEVATAYGRGTCARAPGAVGGGLLLGAGRGGVCSIVFCHAGTLAAARRPSRRCARCGRRWTPWRRTSTARSRRCGTAGNPPGVHAHIRGGYLRELSEAAWSWRSRRRTGRPRALSHVFLRPLGGALAGRGTGRDGAADPGRAVGVPVCRPLAARPGARRRAGRVGRRLRRGAGAVHARAPPPSRRGARATGGGEHAPTAGKAAIGCSRSGPRPRRDLAALNDRAGRGAGRHRPPARGRPATIGEVATLARVSRTTVSHALNGKGGVAPGDARARDRGRPASSTTGRAAPPGRSAPAGRGRSPSSCPPSTRRRSRSGGA